MWKKYYEISEYAIWALFDTTFEENEMYFPGKILSSIFMIAGVVYNTCLLIQILNILNIMHAPRTKYHEVMNQLDAYMQKKKFPMHLQLRLKYFFKKKFRRFFYREDEIMEILSGKAPICPKFAQFARQSRFRAASTRNSHQHRSAFRRACGTFPKRSEESRHPDRRELQEGRIPA